MTLWHELHAGWRGACANCSATDSSRPSFASPVASRSGTSAGGGGGGLPSSTSITHLPRSTGDVRLPCEVSVRTLPCPSRPRRVSSGYDDLAERRSADAANAVVPRQALVDERVVGGQQFQRRSILAHEMLEEQLRLARHRVGERLVVVRERQRIGFDLGQVLEPEPLRREPRPQRGGTIVGEHPSHLPIEHVGPRQSAAARDGR